MKNTKLLLVPILLIIVMIYLSPCILFRESRIIREYDDRSDAGRYERNIHHLSSRISSVPSTAKDEGILAAVSYLQPLSPSGEKPFFIWCGAIMETVLTFTFSKYAPYSLTVLNHVLVCLLSLLVFIFLRTYTSFLFSLLATIVVASSFDLYFHAVEGYHTILGVFLVISGFALAPRHPFLSGLILGFAIFASSHILSVVLSYYFIMSLFMFLYPSQDKKPFLASLTALLCVVGYSFIITLIFREASIPYRSPLEDLLWQATQAHKFGRRIPLFPLYPLEYTAYEYGFILVAGSCVALFHNVLRFARILHCLYKKQERPRISEADKMALVLSFSCLGAIFINFTLRLPVIGRLYTPLGVLLVLVFFLWVGRVTQNLRTRKQYRLASVLVITIALSSVCNSFKLHHDYVYGIHSPVQVPIPAIVTDRFPQVYRASQLNKQLYSKLLKTVNMDHSDSVAIRVAPTAKFVHSTMILCEPEVHIASLMEKGLRPFYVQPYRIFQHINYLNETGYSAFYKGQYEKVMPNFEYFRMLRPGSIYYFSASDIKRYSDIYDVFPEDCNCPSTQPYGPRPSVWNRRFASH